MVLISVSQNSFNSNSLVFLKTWHRVDQIVSFHLTILKQFLPFFLVRYRWKCRKEALKCRFSVDQSLFSHSTIETQIVRGPLPLGIHSGRSDLPVSGQISLQPDLHLHEDRGAKRSGLSRAHFLSLQGPLQRGRAQGNKIRIDIKGNTRGYFLRFFPPTFFYQ